MDNRVDVAPRRLSGAPTPTQRAIRAFAITWTVMTALAVSGWSALVAVLSGTPSSIALSVISLLAASIPGVWLLDRAARREGGDRA